MIRSSIYIYTLIYIVPSIFLFIMSTYIYMRSAYRKDGLLLCIMSFTFALLPLIEFVRHLAPITHSPFLTQYVLGITSIFAICVSLHLIYTLSTNHQEFSLPFAPYIFYSPLLVHLIYSSFIHLQTSDFYRYSIWIHRDTKEYDYLMFSLIGICLLVSLIMLNYSRQVTKSALRKKLLIFLSRGIVALAILFILMITIFQNDSLPPIPTILLGLGTAILIAVAIIRHNLSPSITDRYKIIFDLSPTALLIINDQLEIVEMNKRAIDSFPRIKKPTIQTMFHTSLNMKNAQKVLDDLKKSRILQDYIMEFEDPFTRKLSSYSITASVIRIGDSIKYYIMWRDISEEVEREKLIEHLAYYDSLTNIYNRTYFVPNASKVIQQYVMSDNIAALILLDLNFFKFINDTYGHAVGDLVLIKTAAILKDSVPEYNPMIARLGGDEFVMLIENLPSKNQIDIIIENIRMQFIQQPFHSQKVHITISPSIGYALTPFESIHLDELIQIADKRMYADKIRIKSEDNKEV